ncbi:MAG: WecB/TagA/CpsF family glycosyltransferase [Pseudomonadales bacterium]|nr:WecB/TagA/CpsF family glycosyltransferase [Pseudomonadales bacterium]
MSKGLHTFLNPYSYYVARNHSEVFEAFDSIHIDGGLLVKVLRVFPKARSLKRVSFDMTSLAGPVFERCSSENLRVFLIGAKESEITDAVSLFRQAYPGLDICGYRNGFFESSSCRETAIDNIRNLNPDVVIVGMGTPLQEQFLLDLRHSGWEGTGYTCGGFFHQTGSGRLEYYPWWINRLHLRWLYRMYDEPKLVRRYFTYYPMFFYLFLLDFCKDRVRK